MSVLGLFVSQFPRVNFSNFSCVLYCTGICPVSLWSCSNIGAQRSFRTKLGIYPCAFKLIVFHNNTPQVFCLWLIGITIKMSYT